MKPEGHLELPSIKDSGVDQAGRLDSWKEIASFFRREVRTVQLWERHEHLPVHRHRHRKVGTVHAFKSELREWWNQRCAKNGKPDSASRSAPLSPAAMQGSQHRINLAVLPFGSSTDHLYCLAFARGLTERIASRLDTIMPPRLRVTCSLAVAQRHAQGFCLEDGNRELDADYLLAGMLSGVTPRLQIQVQLTRRKDSTIVWSSSFDYAESGFSDLTRDKITDDLAEKVSRALSNHVFISSHAFKSHTVNLAARYAYLRGRYLWSLRSSTASIFNAMEQFRLATEIDPHHAPAYSGLADCYAVLGWLGAIDRATAMQEARSAALKALAIDGSLAEGHVSMGCVLFDFDWDWVGAEREMLLGIDLNPAYAQAYCWYGHLLSALGRNQEAIHAAQLAQDMDPASPTVGLFLGSALLHAGRYEDAIQQYRHVLHMQPNHTSAHCGLSLAYDQAGDRRSALSHLQFAWGASVNDPNIQAMLAYAHARAGEHKEAEAILDRLRRSEDRQAVPALDAAAAYTALGNPDRAMHYLELGFDQRNARLTKLNCDRRLAPLHSDPRFTSLVRQMRLD